MFGSSRTTVESVIHFVVGTWRDAHQHGGELRKPDPTASMFVENGATQNRTLAN
jgi:hypothetical protein